MTEPEEFVPLPTRPVEMRCPGCGKQVRCRETGHVNPHWVDDGYVCQGEGI